MEGCINCSASDQNNCTKCDNNNGYFENTTTWKCSALCGDGILIVSQEECDDNNTDNYDGCSSTCTIEAGFECSGEPSQCYFIANAALSIEVLNETQVCNTITLGFQISPFSGIFDQSYITWDNFISSPNSSILSYNVSMTSYNNGTLSVSYFLMSYLQNQVLTFDSNFTSLLSNSSIFANTTAPAVSYTVNTSNPAFMHCCVGYFMNTSVVRCDEVCGDGLLFYLECDDGNLIDYDGCSSSCTVEPGFDCSGEPSQCYYTPNASLSIQLMNETQVCNTITFGF